MDNKRKDEASDEYLDKDTFCRLCKEKGKYPDSPPEVKRRRCVDCPLNYDPNMFDLDD